MSHLRYVDEGMSTSGKTERWSVRSEHDDSLLALIRWYGPWRRYVVYYQHAGVMFDAECLTDLAGFLSRMMSERKG